MNDQFIVCSIADVKSYTFPASEQGIILLGKNASVGAEVAVGETQFNAILSVAANGDDAETCPIVTITVFNVDCNVKRDAVTVGAVECGETCIELSKC